MNNPTLLQDNPELAVMASLIIDDFLPALEMLKEHLNTQVVDDADGVHWVNGALFGMTARMSLKADAESTQEEVTAMYGVLCEMLTNMVEHGGLDAAVTHLVPDLS